MSTACLVEIRKKERSAVILNNSKLVTVVKNLQFGHRLLNLESMGIRLKCSLHSAHKLLSLPINDYRSVEHHTSLECGVTTVCS